MDGVRRNRRFRSSDRLGDRKTEIKERQARAQPSDHVTARVFNRYRCDIGRRLGARADPVADSGPDRQLLAEAPVIPALRVPAREPARRPGEPAAAAAERHPGRGAPTAPRLPRDTDAAVDAASGTQHAGDHSRAQLRYQ